MSTLVAYYDLACCPVNYDIVSALMYFERERIRRAAEKVAIEILPGPADGFRNDHNWPYTVGERRKLLNNVVVPMCSMLPSCERVTVHGKRVDKVPSSIGYAEYSMSFKEFCDTYAMGVRPLRASKIDLPPRTITVTLRECDHWPERNSNVEEWNRAVYNLEVHMGCNVIVIRDEAKEQTDLNTNLMRRADLYVSADLNLFINNGPAWLAFALDAPAIVFRPITETNCWAHTEEGMSKFGVRRNQQMKGAPPHQYLCWGEETSDNIVKEARAFFQHQRNALEAADVE